MALEWFLTLVLFGVLHVMLAVMLLHDLIDRERVLGGHKAPWALVIIFLTFVGPLLYLLCHPKIFYN